MKRLAPSLLIAVFAFASVAAEQAAPQPTSRKTEEAGDASAIVGKLSKMPKGMWPASGEQPVAEQARKEWLEKNMHNRTDKMKVTGKLVAVESTNLRTTGPNNTVSVAMATIDCGTASLWGADYNIVVRAVFPKVTPEQAANWKVGDALNVVGSTTGGGTVKIEGNKITVFMGSSFGADATVVKK